MTFKTTAYGTTDIARICRVTPPTVGRWIDEGKLPSFTTAGGHRRVWDKDLAAFCRAHNIPLPPELAGAGMPRVLVVDDDPAVRRFVARALAQNRPDIEVAEAADGFEAGRKVTQLAPDLVVLDWQLPGVHGSAICRMIRADAELKGTRILAISGNPPEETRREALKAGADDFLPKPFDLAQLLARLSRLVPSAATEAGP